MSRSRGELLLAALVVASGCARTTMAPAPAPTGWEEGVLQGRADKDRYFATDPESPLKPEDKAGFRGLDYWPPDARYRLAGFLEPFDPPQPATIVTTSGVERPCEKVGRVTFRLPGGAGELTVYRLLDQERREGGEGLFLPFMDLTTGKTTYGAGRYVELEGPEGGPYVLDFNLAYNPLCAYGMPERYRCPATPRENRLPFAVEAGERGWVGHGG